MSAFSREVTAFGVVAVERCLCLIIPLSRATKHRCKHKRRQRKKKKVDEAAGRHGARRHAEQITIVQNVLVLVGLVGESRSPKFTVVILCCV